MNYHMNQKGISLIVIILIIVGVLTIGGGIWYWQKQTIKENITIISPSGIDNIIQQSGFSKDEAELIIEAVIKAGAKREEILQINKMTNGKVGVMTVDPNSYGPKRGGAMGYSAGKLYYLIEKDSNWKVELTSMWVE